MERNNLLGAGLMVASMTAYTVNDALLKLLANEIPLFQAIFIRGIVATVSVFLLAYVLGQWPRTLSRREWSLILVRSAAEVGAAYFFLTALFNMAISISVAILQIIPLTVALAGTVFLNERIGLHRIAAISIGFAGALLIIQPGTEGFNFYSVYVLAAVLSITLRDIVVRKLDPATPSIFVAGVASAAVCLAFGVAATTEPWVAMSLHSMVVLSGATVAIVGGYILAVAATRHGEIGFVTPFRFSSVAVALIIGVLVFDETPNALMLLGLMIVISSGIYTIYRERYTGQMARR